MTIEVKGAVSAQFNRVARSEIELDKVVRPSEKAFEDRAKTAFYRSAMKGDASPVVRLVHHLARIAASHDFEKFKLATDRLKGPEEEV